MCSVIAGRLLARESDRSDRDIRTGSLQDVFPGNGVRALESDAPLEIPQF